MAGIMCNLSGSFLISFKMIKYPQFIACTLVSADFLPQRQQSARKVAQRMDFSALRFSVLS
jgi:hypothetical protein